MADKVTERNIRQFAGLKNGYAEEYQPTVGEDFGAAELAQLQSMQWEEVPSASSFRRTSASSSGLNWEEVPEKKGAVEALKKTVDFGSQISDAAGEALVGKTAWSNMKGAGNAVRDFVGGIPGFIAGTGAGAATAIVHKDPEGGLDLAKNVMSKSLPSTVLGLDTTSSGYKMASKPVELISEGIETAGKGYGEIAKLLGVSEETAKKIAASTELGLMGGMAAGGIPRRTAKSSSEAAAAKLEKPTESLNDILAETDKQNIQLEVEKLQKEYEDSQYKSGETLPRQAETIRLMQQAEAERRGILFDAAEVENAGKQGELNFGLDLEPEGGSLRNRTAPGEYIGEPIPYDTKTAPELYKGRQESVDLGENFDQYKARLDGEADIRARADSFNLYSNERDFPPNSAIADALRAAEENAAYKERGIQKEAEVEAAYGQKEYQKTAELERIRADVERQFAANIRRGMPHPEAVKEAQARMAMEQADIESRYRNREDFNQPNAGEMVEKFRKAQEESYYKQQVEQQRQLKEEAFKEAESLKERQQIQMENQRQLDLARKAGEIDYMELQRVGDKSLLSERGTYYLVDSIEHGALRAALDVIAGMSDNADYRVLARYLGEKATGIKTRLHDVGIMLAGDRGYTGYFDSVSGEVGFSRQGAMSPHTVLHEATHAMTSQFLLTKPNHFLSRNLNNIYKQVRGKQGFDNFRHIINEREFVAEAFSNPEFQSWLKKQIVAPSGAIRTAWNKFVEGVRNILGIKAGNMANALGDTIDIGRRIIDRSTEKFRYEAQNQLQAAGMPKKIIDYMATKKPEPAQTTKSVEPWKKLPGLKHAVEDFAFGPDKPEAVIELAKQSDDIPSGTVEKLSQQLQAGGLFQSLKTRNPVVKNTYERITRAAQEAAEKINTNLTDRETGLKSYMRDLTTDMKAEIWMQMMMDEGHKLRTSDELARQGYSESQIAFYQRYRELDKRFLDEWNKTREEIGLHPVDERVAHMAGRFMGPFSQMGISGGKAIAPIHGSSIWELRKAVDWMKKNHPEYEWGPVQYREIGKGKNAGDRFGGLMEAINFIEKADGDVKTLMDTYREYVKTDANNIFNMRRHEKPKAESPGGRTGSEGNKPWKDAVENAQEGMKAQLEYFEQGYTWMAMQKAVKDISQVLSDKEVIDRQKNAVEWSNKYVDHALGRDQGWLADAANDMLSYVGKTTGVGHTNIAKVSNQAKHLMMQKFMGFFNFPFTVTQLMQPVQTHPAMLTLLKQRGLEFSVSKSQVAATEAYLASLHPSMLEKASQFDKDAVAYAKKNGIFDVKLSDHTKDITESPLKENFDKIADFNISAPEHLTRGTSFFFYAHLLKEAGIPAKDILGAAENLTNFTMTNYHHFERPWMYSGMGWLGDVASTLTRYKHNQGSQIAFYAREGVRGMKDGQVTASAPLGMFLGAALAFGGIMGMFGYNEADQAYQLLTKHVLKKPDTLTNAVFQSDAPEWLTHGIFALMGVDMSSRFSHSQTIPDNAWKFLMPYGSALWDVADAGLDVAKSPTDSVQWKRFGKAIAPQSVQGHIENQFFTEKQPDGSNLYMNPRTLQGKIKRTDDEMQLRGFGLRTMKESKELASNYSDTVVKQANADLRDDVIAKAQRLYVQGKMTPETARELAQEYVKYEGTPEGFGSTISTFARNRRMTEIQREFINGSIYDKQRAAKRMNATK